MIRPLSQRRLCKSQRTVDFQGGVSSDFFWSLVVQRGTRIYSLVLNLHVLQHLHVCVPWFPRLQKGQHLLINAKLPTSKSVSTVQQRKGGFSYHFMHDCERRRHVPVALAVKLHPVPFFDFALRWLHPNADSRGGVWDRGENSASFPQTTLEWRTACQNTSIKQLISEVFPLWKGTK